jgi:hypothetical protein
LESFPDNGRLESARDLNDVRNYLLDLIAVSKETAVPDIRTRMIRLQAKPPTAPPAIKDLSNLVVEPVSLISGAGLRQITLSQNAELTDMLDRADRLIEKLEADGVYQIKDWRVLRRITSAYEGGRIVHKCLAIRIMPEQPQRKRDI